MNLPIKMEKKLLREIGNMGGGPRSAAWYDRISNTIRENPGLTAKQLIWKIPSRGTLRGYTVYQVSQAAIRLEAAGRVRIERGKNGWNPCKYYPSEEK